MVGAERERCLTHRACSFGIEPKQTVKPNMTRERIVSAKVARFTTTNKKRKQLKHNVGLKTKTCLTTSQPCPKQIRRSIPKQGHCDPLRAHQLYRVPQAPTYGLNIPITTPKKNSAGIYPLSLILCAETQRTKERRGAPRRFRRSKTDTSLLCRDIQDVRLGAEGANSFSHSRNRPLYERLGNCREISP